MRFGPKYHEAVPMHRWFAWHPVYVMSVWKRGYVNDLGIVWLEWVYRGKTGMGWNKWIYTLPEDLSDKE